MRIARAKVEGSSFVGRVDGDGTFVPIAHAPEHLGADVLRDALADGVDLAALPAIAPAAPVGTYALLAPVAAPQKIVAIGLNYVDHAHESGIELPKAPVAFAKMPSSLVGHDAVISYARTSSEQVDYEAELAVVIGRRARNVPVGSALDHVFGYTACNDVSARDAQFADGQWVRGKSFDTFCPLGPWIVTSDEIGDPQCLAIQCRINGELLQDGTTKDMVFGVAEIVSYLSQVMTLEPGDVIATGTPVGVGFARTPPRYLTHGDVVEVEVEGIGALRNRVEVLGDASR